MNQCKRKPLSLRNPGFQSLLSRVFLPDGVKSVGAAVSGGCDSVAMLLLLKHFCRIKKIRLCVFHVDHSLRPTSSLDCEWVKKLAQSLGLSFFCRTASVERVKQTAEKGVEAWARQFRYESLADMSAQEEVNAVLTGHTADDQMETLLMRLFSGSSLQGMGAIRNDKNIVLDSGLSLRVIRPILTIQRNELEKALTDLQQPWLEDETNSSEDFLRNAVRKRISPEVLRLFPQAPQKAALFVNDLDESQEFLKKQALNYLSLHCCGKVLALEPLLPPVLRREIIRLWLIELGFCREISRGLIERITDLWQVRSRNRQVSHGSFVFIRRKDSLEFVSETDLPVSADK
ncbi:MAG: tRNA lysidine(34) synthetase TilS [Candidatus Rifleibacteriota bacterium]